MVDEVDLVVERYERRKAMGVDSRYNIINAAVWQALLEKQKALFRLLSAHLNTQISETTLLEIGCGSGSNLVELIRLGFDPSNLIGNELLDEKLALARKNLPNSVVLYPGDATSLNILDESLDLVYQSTVFSSLIDNEFQQDLANNMWRWVKPGGAILWYDFIYNNPSNPDVRGVSLKRVKTLFPEAKISTIRVTLAPPISRRVTKIHSSLYTLCNLFPFLRTHVFCWIQKN
ncbi:class I SAM-dependent methyltransferase [Paralcaligenes ginsengisoli]